MLVLVPLVGLFIAAGVGVPLTAGLLLGALVAATDRVAVVSLFRALGAPELRTVLIEGESMFALDLTDYRLARR